MLARPIALALLLVACAPPAPATERLQARFERAHLTYPPRRVHIAIYKSERELELWASNVARGPYTRVHRYRICGLSGDVGPKRRQGDRQAPEGFYFVDRFNPHSRHVVSLGLSYPNDADRAASRARRLGGDIFIHGGCSSAGCFAVGDRATEEIYSAALAAREAGQDRIDVHVYPARLTPRRFARLVRERPRHRAFWASLRPAYDRFQRTHEPAPISIDARGRYLIATSPSDDVEATARYRRRP
ncbi:MAG: L,D-transpeptidase family protein [Sandaracinaceae bacterium]|nr:L,D-transpeptidase family protein [Sandaracinaceae bacterium]